MRQKLCSFSRASKTDGSLTLEDGIKAYEAMIESINHNFFCVRNVTLYVGSCEVITKMQLTSSLSFTLKETALSYFFLFQIGKIPTQVNTVTPIDVSL